MTVTEIYLTMIVIAILVIGGYYIINYINKNLQPVLQSHVVSSPYMLILQNLNCKYYGVIRYYVDNREIDVFITKTFSNFGDAVDAVTPVYENFKSLGNQFFKTLK